MVKLIQITAADDPRVSPFRDVRERDLARRDGLFIAEGKVVVAAMLAARRFLPRSMLVLDRRVDGLADALHHAPDDLPVYVAAQEVIDAVAGFHLHRGILALAERQRPETLAAVLQRLPALCTVPVLVGISNHDNMGSIFRNAAAFDSPAVLLDPASCDPLYRKAIRVSVGGALTVPYAQATDLTELVTELDAAGFRQFALSPGAVETLDTQPRGGRTAIYLGTEGDGLPAALMQQLNPIRISMSRRFDSLNVAAASAIALSYFFEGS